MSLILPEDDLCVCCDSDGVVDQLCINPFPDEEPSELEPNSAPAEEVVDPLTEFIISPID